MRKDGWEWSITKVCKEKQFLVFYLDNGQTVKFDFATMTAIGPKGNPVRDLKVYLANISIEQMIDCCEDEKYGKFLRFVKRKEKRISNIGTILSRVPKYANYEQIFSAGIEDIISDGGRFAYKINDIPKGLIKLAQTKNIKLSNRFLEYYKENPDAHLLAYNLEYMSLTDSNIEAMLNASIWRNPKYHSYFNVLINEYGYNAKKLLLYIDQLKTLEALDSTFSIIQELYDYARMMKTISNKFEKYPRHFLTTHKIACRNYNRLKKEFSEELFKKRITKDYECTFGDYCFIYPNSTQDIKDEAVAQNNCVASYIDKVIDGNCHIMFLRKKDNPDKSLVTIEIQQNQIVQARRRFNYSISEEEQEAVDKWNKKYSNLKIA